MSWFKTNRCPKTKELMKCPNAYMLLLQIAYHARRSNAFSIDDLEIGQAFVGDYKSIGLTEQKYRTAKIKLSKWGFATFKGTRLGTIATLIGSTIFDINIEPLNDPNNGQITDKERPANEPATTNKKLINQEDNKQQAAVPDVSLPEKDLAYLKAWGVNLDSVSFFPIPVIQEKIVLVLNRQAGGTEIKNPGGYFVDALKGGWKDAEAEERAKLVDRNKEYQAKLSRQRVIIKTCLQSGQFITHAEYECLTPEDRETLSFDEEHYNKHREWRYFLPSAKQAQAP